ncbi:MAG TPA: acyl-CoA dehydrogenase family protein [Pirellulaceae bacterium]|nr:acyl-CoA dehydrogenase family protein [Pirellulaceae bacterium]
MDFQLTDDQRAWQSKILALAESELNAGLNEREAQSIFNFAGWRRCAEIGIHGLPIPREYGGQGADPVTTALALESLGYGSHDNGLNFAINAHMWTVEIPLLEFGTEAQRQQWLPGLCSGQWIGANAVSEPEAGSDVFSMQMRAEKRDGHYVLNGHKTYITSGPIADLFVVFAVTDPSRGKHGITAFLVEGHRPGLHVIRRIDKMGMNTAQMGEIKFEDCEVPESHRLGKEGAGAMLFTHSMTWERSMILAPAVGAMRRIVETCVKFARSRRQFGEPIGRFQLVASKIVDMKLRLETARQMLYSTAWHRSQGSSVFMEAALTKLHISESWVQTCLDAVQVHGAAGYLKDLTLERELRDSIGSRIYSGTSEIQKVIIASLLGL